MVDADFPRRAFIQTFDDVPRDYQCPARVKRSRGNSTLWRSSIPKWEGLVWLVGAIPKSPQFSTVRPVVAELKRRGVEIQLRTTENVPLGGVKLGGF